MKFNKIILQHEDYGYPSKIVKTNDKIIVNFSLLTFKQIIKKEELHNVWAYDKIIKTHVKGIYAFSMEGFHYWDYCFKPTGIKKLIVLYYMYREILFTVFIGGIFAGLVSNILFYLLTLVF